MDKWEIIEITLDQLIRRWNSDKESFVTDTNDKPTRHNELYVAWEPDDGSCSLTNDKVKKGVLVAYSKGARSFTCRVYHVTMNMGTRNVITEDSLSATKKLPQIRSLYRKFMCFREDIRQHEINKSSGRYLDNLCTMLPDTLDRYILGSDNE